jgi:hypothetical protein
MARDRQHCGAKDTGKYDPRSARAVDCGEIGLEKRELQQATDDMQQTMSNSSRRQQSEIALRLNAQQ